MRGSGKLWIVLPGLLGLSGCVGWQSALDPQGPQSEHLTRLIWIFTIISAAIWVAVMAVMLIAILRRAPGRSDPLTLQGSPQRRRPTVVGGAAAATPLTPIAFTPVSLLSPRQP